jgi:hypothetical protein
MSQDAVGTGSGAIRRLQITAANANADEELSDNDAPMYGPELASVEIVGENADVPPGELSPVSRARSFAAQTVINGQSSRDVIIAARERLTLINNAMRAASATPAAHVNFHDGAAMEAPRGQPSWNKQWLNVVLTFAKDRKYDGLLLVPQTHDQKTRFQAYKYNVGAAIKLCQGPKYDLTSVGLVEDHCAILLCDGSVLQIVIDFTERTNRDPSKAEMFALLDQ